MDSCARPSCPYPADLESTSPWGFQESPCGIFEGLPGWEEQLRDGQGQWDAQNLPAVPAVPPAPPSFLIFFLDALKLNSQCEEPHQQLGNEALLTCRVTNEEKIIGSKLHQLFGLFGKRKLSSPIFPSHPKPRSPPLPSYVSLPCLPNDQCLSLPSQILGAGIPSGTWLWLSALQPSLPGAMFDG